MAARLTRQKDVASELGIGLKTLQRILRRLCIPWDRSALSESTLDRIRRDVGGNSRRHNYSTDVGSPFRYTYRSYRGMIERCYWKKWYNFDKYGGRGIKVCDRWRIGEDGKSGFDCFVEDMGQRPAGLSIDRIDNDGNYEPGNCRWATRSQQNRNKRRRAVDHASAN